MTAQPAEPSLNNRRDCGQPHRLGRFLVEGSTEQPLQLLVQLVSHRLEARLPRQARQGLYSLHPRWHGRCRVRRELQERLACRTPPVLRQRPCRASVAVPPFLGIAQHFLLRRHEAREKLRDPRLGHAQAARREHRIDGERSFDDPRHHLRCLTGKAEEHGEGIVPAERPHLALEDGRIAGFVSQEVTGGEILLKGLMQEAQRAVVTQQDLARHDLFEQRRIGQPLRGLGLFDVRGATLDERVAEPAEKGRLVFKGESVRHHLAVLLVVAFLQIPTGEILEEPATAGRRLTGLPVPLDEHPQEERCLRQVAHLGVLGIIKKDLGQALAKLLPGGGTVFPKVVEDIAPRLGRPNLLEAHHRERQKPGRVVVLAMAGDDRSRGKGLTQGHEPLGDALFVGLGDLVQGIDCEVERPGVEQIRFVPESGRDRRPVIFLFLLVADPQAQIGRPQDHRQPWRHGGLTAPDDRLRQAVLPFPRDGALARSGVADQHHRRLLGEKPQHVVILSLSTAGAAQPLCLGERWVAVEHLVERHPPSLAPRVQPTAQVDVGAHADVDPVVGLEIDQDLVGLFGEARPHKVGAQGFVGFDKWLVLLLAASTQGARHGGQIAEGVPGLGEAQDLQAVAAQVFAAPVPIEIDARERFRHHPGHRRRGTQGGGCLVGPLEGQVGEEEELFEVVAQPVLTPGLGAGVARGAAQRPEDPEGGAQWGAFGGEPLRETVGAALAESARRGKQALQAQVLRQTQVLREDVACQAAFEAGEVEEERLLVLREGVVDEERPVADEEDVARIEIAVDERRQPPAAAGFENPRQGLEGVGNRGFGQLRQPGVEPFAMGARPHRAHPALHVEGGSLWQRGGEPAQGAAIGIGRHQLQPQGGVRRLPHQPVSPPFRSQLAHFDPGTRLDLPVVPRRGFQQGARVEPRGLAGGAVQREGTRGRVEGVDLNLQGDAEPQIPCIERGGLPVLDRVLGVEVVLDAREERGERLLSPVERRAAGADRLVHELLEGHRRLCRLSGEARRVVIDDRLALGSGLRRGPQHRGRRGADRREERASVAEVVVEGLPLVPQIMERPDLRHHGRLVRSRADDDVEHRAAASPVGQPAPDVNRVGPFAPAARRRAGLDPLQHGIELGLLLPGEPLLEGDIHERIIRWIATV